MLDKTLEENLPIFSSNLCKTSENITLEYLSSFSIGNKQKKIFIHTYLSNSIEHIASYVSFPFVFPFLSISMQQIAPLTRTRY